MTALAATWTPALLALLGLAAGLVLGFVHFSSLRWVAARYSRAGAEGGMGLTVAVHLLRFLVLAGVLFALAKLGALALLGGALGLLCARHLVVRGTGGAPWTRR